MTRATSRWKQDDTLNLKMRHINLMRSGKRLCSCRTGSSQPRDWWHLFGILGDTVAMRQTHQDCVHQVCLGVSCPLRAEPLPSKTSSKLR